jgi:hypothetical protein
MADVHVAAKKKPDPVMTVPVSQSKQALLMTSH